MVTMETPPTIARCRPWNSPTEFISSLPRVDAGHYKGTAIGSLIREFTFTIFFVADPSGFLAVETERRVAMRYDHIG